MNDVSLKFKMQVVHTKSSLIIRFFCLLKVKISNLHLFDCIRNPLRYYSIAYFFSTIDKN
ncbi:hypothetical protein BFAG_04703 [Bacteroides fragilis 3_1_12]|uniref:Uncharacterized protein n=1 Tax=Bacteroides fragilis 3_1_12 TaxID=457424 RepID=A0ABN0BT09_BACFG|nr:hypothetical protein BFAG_04703 [Bacteroides fragilis 3_1_12]